MAIQGLIHGVPPPLLTCCGMAEMQQPQAFRGPGAQSAVDRASSLRHKHQYGGTTWARRDDGRALAEGFLERIVTCGGAYSW